MGEAYPELKKARAHVEKVLKKEELRFAETLDQGMEILEDAIANLKGNEIPGDIVFKLYDTYGFPVDLTADIARERGLAVDEKGFEEAMEGQRDRARAASKFGVKTGEGIETDIETGFSGYEGTEAASEIVALFADGKPVKQLMVGEDGAVILSSTPFYAESGGQVGDTGILSAGDHSFTVIDTQKSGKANVHYGSVQAGEIRVGDKVTAHVDAERRQAIRLNHSATHLMHAALRDVLGDHVQQKGSLVAPDRLRFDFSHDEPVTKQQLARIEELVNDEIRRNVAAETRLMSYDDAVKSGAIALFGEKYDDEVRVLNFGVRRIEAVTGKGALEWIDANEKALDDVAGILKSQRDQAPAKIEQLLKRNKELEKELAATKQALVTGSAGGRTEDVTEIGGIKVLATRIDDADARTLRDAVDRYKDKLQSAVIVLGSVDNGVVRLAAGVTKNNTDRIKAGDLIKPVAEQVGGKGGGRPDFAQAGGNNPEALDKALGSVSGWVAEQLG